ncbi:MULTISPECIES: hypothetical protein [unclassified Bradyrhizobium]|uniref:hypothetical protein n=1 Tax=unclassified Bradyrhizobium TaxID=2631580 RepID=UPI001FF9A69C|nr:MULTISPECIES: hypothetical protein [unclassified Bradyrhizobium]MCK1306454.1 hypothetical protein [Bradyrhizobium sp. 45]MCK1436861.1 hypothetical protein [Bradyrhizobium sp. 15]MCK1608072.1 hypothetical protein [Bradyrhizobium sp. 163]MCK1766628.1 hypothetical protein [Bradyrhizobium sp. 136]
MADTAPVVHIGENSPEKVAYVLMERIAQIERKSLHDPNPSTSGWTGADRKWLLDTYAECLNAAKGFR